MNNGQRVRVKLHGDSSWYSGIVIKARKQWVRLSGYPSGRFIADENSIEKWKVSKK